MEENLAQYICSILQDNRLNAGFIVQNVQYIPAQVKIVKCTVNDIPVDISFNQMAGLSALCFLEKVDQLIGEDHLLKRSIILIKAWCYYESRILGAHHGLISTYALETMILHIINVFHSSLCGPLSVLYKFLDYYSSTFDWANYCITISGPVPISSLPAVFAGTPETDGDELLLSRDFLRYCRETFCASLQSLEIGANAFPVKYMNIVDPLKVHNNLGRSVSKGNFHRIRCALTYGTQTLGEVLMLPGENMGIGLEKFFVNTLNRNGRGQRPDVQIPVHAFGTGKSEVSRLSGDFDVYYNALLYSQWYHYYALNVPVMPATTVSSPSQTPKHGAWDALRLFVRCKRNTFYRKGMNVFIPRLQFVHPFALQLPAAYGIDNMTKSRGTGTYIPYMTHQSYSEMQACTSKRRRNHKPSTLVPSQNLRKENDPIENNRLSENSPNENDPRGNGNCPDLGLSTEQFPLLPSTKRTTAAGPSRSPAFKSPVPENGGSQFLSAIKFGCYEGSSTHSPSPSLKDPRLCMPLVEKKKKKELCERKRAPREPFQLQDDEDFPLLSM
ncbi:Melibiase family protein isoform 1 [Hibiscus syriacus]|uniref:Melibiase family protein isoform 1 n=2 Tax=Hibiscus syriacus TaxID=106335 RepID=A0A6A3C736_HIBSY|nr:Melibiase family protein isoform 1 [Hibiscus syriacus]